MLKQKQKQCIDADQQEDLERDVSNEEIKKAVWDCGTDKSPGPDGFTFIFYRHYWNTIKKDVVEAVKHFFSKTKIPNGCNSSFIALIPKTHDANMVKDFRPICLIGSIYKIIAKILTNRLVGVLGDIVSEVQSAFVEGRQILGGPFILNEKTSLWTRVIKAIYGEDGRINSMEVSGIRSCWKNIVMEVKNLRSQGIMVDDFMQLKICNGESVSFWNDNWQGGGALKSIVPRLYALENCKEIKELADKINLVPIEDRWKWSLNSSGDFSVSSIRKVIDINRIPSSLSKTRWVKYVPIKVNVLAWKIKLDALPTRLNISRQWSAWLVSLHLGVKSKLMFEGIFYTLWWFIWFYRNNLIFDANPPLKAMIYDNVISSFFFWCRYCDAPTLVDQYFKKPIKSQVKLTNCVLALRPVNALDVDVGSSSTRRKSR
uniref:RNA-directed DNA polymerase, eukaryota n=1 Tax=Tanacetum cinerariifolium TaxID=118510 RepID=A0A6L2LCS3_TANCI|nr:RNA-directed DNA polymerase, eukaryota [Tanacetum cinerariifolium]